MLYFVHPVAVHFNLLLTVFAYYNIFYIVWRGRGGAGDIRDIRAITQVNLMLHLLI